MEKFIKENWLKVLLVFCLLLISGSVSYYYLFFLPNLEKQKIVKIENDKQISELNDYNKWKDEKKDQDTKEIGSEIEKRWSEPDKDNLFNDNAEYDGVREHRYFKINGQVVTLPGFSQDDRDKQLKYLIDEEKDNDKKELLRSLGEIHKNWMAGAILMIVNKEIIPGMTEEMVKLSWGEPDNVVEKTDHTIWWYWRGDIDRSKKRDVLVFGPFKLLFTHRDE